MDGNLAPTISGQGSRRPLLGNPIPEEAMFFHGFFDTGKEVNGRHRTASGSGGLPLVDAFGPLPSTIGMTVALNQLTGIH